jgi:spore coat protein U-like protein
MRTSKPWSILVFFLFLFFLTAITPVSAQLSVSVSPESNYNNLNFTASQTDLLVMTVTEICTDTGYTVTLETKNGTTTGLFRGINPANSDSIAYEIKYNDILAVLSAGSAIVTDSASSTGPSGVEKQIKISYSGSGSLAADSYTDTITLTIAVK